MNPLHLLIILGVALLVLGPKRLPDAGRSLGSAIKGFRASMSEDTLDLPAAARSTVTEMPAPATPTVDRVVDAERATASARG